jgi:hypothetical protein
VSAAILSTLLLVSPALPLVRPTPAGAALPSLVEPESGAWAVVDGDGLWVCWEPDSDCFVRIELEIPESAELDLDLDLDLGDGLGLEFGLGLELGVDPGVDLGFDFGRDPSFASEPGLDLATDSDAEPRARAHNDDLATDWRLGFSGPRSLWIARGDHRWRLDAGQRRASATDEPAPLRLQRVGPAACSPDGLAPARVAGRWQWRVVKRCRASVPASVCVRPAGPRVRAPTAVRIRAGLELRRTQAWTIYADPSDPSDPADPGAGWVRRRMKGDVAVRFVVELGFDPAGLAQRRALTQITHARQRAKPRSLPAIEAGPTAARERAAMTAILCGGGQ